MQDKAQEKDFFNAFSAAGEYDVFTPSGYKTLIKEYRKLIRVPGPSGSRVVDLGCGTGAFSRRFKEMREVFLDCPRISADFNHLRRRT